jgi:signal transduction histidine kinase
VPKRVSFEHDQADSTALLAELASVIAHDVRTPVRHIGQFLEFYERELEAGNTTQAAAHFDIVKDSISRVSEMLDGIVTYARLGRGLDEPTEVNLKKLAASAFERAMMSEERSNAVLDYRGDEACIGHDVRIQEMFVHLFENALVHTPKDQDLTVRVDVYRGEQDTHIEIRDNGPGIPDGYEKIIFDMFQKGGKREEEDKPVGGLGLPLARRIARLHGGDLTLERQSGAGADKPASVFVVTLPNSEILT